jgi:hypothetical protein
MPPLCPILERHPLLDVMLADCADEAREARVRVLDLGSWILDLGYDTRGYQDLGGVFVEIKRVSARLRCASALYLGSRHDSCDDIFCRIHFLPSFLAPDMRLKINLLLRTWYGSIM